MNGDDLPTHENSLPIRAERTTRGDSVEEPVVVIRDLCVTYRGGVVAIDSLSLSVERAEFLVVLGPSGCGKSTLLLNIAGLLRPTAGEIVVGGQVNPRPGKDRAFVFQQAGLLPWFDVRTNIELGPRAMGMSRKAAREVSKHQIGKMRLEGFGHLYPHQLSGGMQQRVGVARAFAVDPPILLMDEPFGALDAQTRMLLQEELIQLWEGTGKTVIFVTHSIEEALFLADRVVVMTARPGRVRDIIDVPLPRPRGEDTRSMPEYLQLHTHLWEMIRGDAQRALSGAAQVEKS